MPTSALCRPPNESPCRRVIANVLPARRSFPGRRPMTAERLEGRTSARAERPFVVSRNYTAQHSTSRASTAIKGTRPDADNEKNTKVELCWPSCGSGSPSCPGWAFFWSRVGRGPGCPIGQLSFPGTGHWDQRVLAGGGRRGRVQLRRRHFPRLGGPGSSHPDGGGDCRYS
jgi:hypothetical protein